MPLHGTLQNGESYDMDSLRQTKPGAVPVDRQPPGQLLAGLWLALPPSLSARSFTTCLPVSMPTENGNKRLAPGTLAARLELGRSASLRHTHVGACQRTGAPSGRRSLRVRLTLIRGGWGEAGGLFTQTSQRNGLTNQLTSAHRNNVTGRPTGKQFGCPVARGSLGFCCRGLLVCWLVYTPPFPKPHGRCRLRTQRRGSRLCVTIPVGGAVLGEGSLLIENSSHPSLAPQTRQISGGDGCVH